MVAFSNQANKYVIWTQEVGSRGLTAVPGTEGASHPFWSSEWTSIRFFAQGKPEGGWGFREIAAGRCATRPARSRRHLEPGWGDPVSPEGFRRPVPSVGGGRTPIEVTKAEASLTEFSPPLARLSAGTDGHYIYLAANFWGSSRKTDLRRLAGLGGTTTDRERQSNAVYAEPGYLLYMRDNALVAQLFDSGSMR